VGDGDITDPYLLLVALYFMSTSYRQIFRVVSKGT
jgi:hypothetical protein